MPSSNMKYIVRSPDGKEYGPVDQDALIQWAQAGRITEHYEIRNALMNKGNPAHKVPFLKDIIEKQKSIRDRHRPMSTRFSQLIDPEDEREYQQLTSLNQPGRFQFAPGPTDLRFLAWLIDTVIIILVGSSLFATALYLIQGSTNEYYAFVSFTLLFLAFILMYYTISLGITAQTVGHWFAGLMVVRTKGGPVLMGRAFIFSVFYILFFWTTLLFTYCLPSKRAIQDKLSGIRVVKITTG